MAQRINAKPGLVGRALQAIGWSFAALVAYAWWDATFYPPMTAQCAYMLDEHPVGLDATLSEGTLDQVMRCRLDQLRYGQKRWHVPMCTDADIAFARSRPDLAVRICR